jgi:hypothetical protein
MAFYLLWLLRVLFSIELVEGKGLLAEMGQWEGDYHGMTSGFLLLLTMLLWGTGRVVGLDG